MKDKKCAQRDGSANRDEQVIHAFGEEWSRFSQESLGEADRRAIFNDYFSDFPWSDLPADAYGADIGCGSGRWAIVVAPRVGKLACVDASGDALEVAQRNLAGFCNVTFWQSDVGRLPFSECELDFAYSLGVLHHVPDTEGAISNVARALKPGAPFLIYLYYKFDNRPQWFRLLWGISDALRQVICRMPSPIRFYVCDTLAALIYWPLAKLASLNAILGSPVRNFPLTYYRDKTFYVMRTDALDRFGTRLEKRFSRVQIAVMLEAAGFSDIRFSASEPYWCVVARKSR